MAGMWNRGFCICTYLCFYHVVHFPFTLANTATLCGIDLKSIFSMEYSQTAPKFCKLVRGVNGCVRAFTDTWRHKQRRIVSKAGHSKSVCDWFSRRRYHWNTVAQKVLLKREREREIRVSDLSSCCYQYYTISKVCICGNFALEFFFFFLVAFWCFQRMWVNEWCDPNTTFCCCFFFFSLLIITIFFFFLV